ncbi:hypothetical protein CEXT_57321 [Caerostris extrusa]|uniref:Uncharacterized protein n=1 Tax=Caerostris extrusa TaxID=172846 RepID=A0AAV4VTB1_CAEEX|nr:hypothetical protein CEXT_57321 [Caerostris extrusa]
MLKICLKFIRPFKNTSYNDFEKLFPEGNQKSHEIFLPPLSPSPQSNHSVRMDSIRILPELFFEISKKIRRRLDLFRIPKGMKWDRAFNVGEFS